MAICTCHLMLTIETFCRLLCNYPLFAFRAAYLDTEASAIDLEFGITGTRKITLRRGRWKRSASSNLPEITESFRFRGWRRRMGVLAGLLQSLPERREDVAWFGASVQEGWVMEESKRGGKNADTFIGTGGPVAPAIWSSWRFYFDRDRRTCVSARLPARLQTRPSRGFQTALFSHDKRMIVD